MVCAIVEMDNLKLFLEYGGQICLGDSEKTLGGKVQ